ncbi:MAG TPA: hypothetical protein VNN72_24805 [Polyangiaceae bacterium]|nr:hypothetical protein [Polyangiaceae bacterium]
MLRTGVAITIFMAWAGVSRTASAQEEPPRPEEGAVPSTPSEPNATPAPPPARADEVAACVKSAENAQTERSAHRLRAARERLLACAQASCPSVVRNDCATWLSEVDQLLPSVVVQARDTRGLELFDVRVIVDGQLVTSHLDGLAVPVDPGSHLFQFEADGAPTLQQQILIREGEKGRALPITLAAPAPTPAHPKPTRRTPPLTYVFGGLGIAGLAGFTYFGIKGTADAAELRDSCGKDKSCRQDQVDPVHRELVVADVCLAVGLVSMGTALYFYLTDKPPTATHGVTPAVVFAPGMARVSIETPF